VTCQGLIIDPEAVKVMEQLPMHMSRNEFHSRMRRAEGSRRMEMSNITRDGHPPLSKGWSRKLDEYALPIENARVNR
jgi:hypothetical protein